MNDASRDLDRAIRVRRGLKRFIDACREFLWIEGLPLAESPAQLRNIQKFEGVIEVYPVAFDLLEAIGPGHGREVAWMPADWSPRLRSLLQDAAHHARSLIREQWG